MYLLEGNNTSQRIEREGWRTTLKKMTGLQLVFEGQTAGLS